ncbi:MAG: hypothetical protein K8I29_11490 [Alphaproteobacteria bacterium]|uniref:Uncharacterized protein n=1 Tax=Candidatus Nitrobium versatile TaxID=2884831 RepID=A0A953JFI3_9BACT|nr:hypothetical protein [Candidatus Nitrobium versatile]
MNFFSTLKEGIHVVHKNWPLVLAQFISMILSCASFFVIVGIPIAIAFIMFGLDLTDILRFKDVVSAFKGSAELLNKYFGMALVILMSLLLYIMFIVVLWTFTIAGTIGIVARTIQSGIQKFSFKEFFVEGKRLFFPVLVYSSLIGLIFITLAFILGILAGGASSIIELARSQEATLGLFFGVFFFLVLLSIGFFLILVTLSGTVYGIACMTFTHSSPWAALKSTMRYIFSVPSSLILYALLFIGYMVTGFFVILVGSPLTLIPLIGPILSLPYQVVTYFIQGYISLIMLASLFLYYYRTGYLPSLPVPVPAPAEEAGLSTEADTSPKTDEGQAPAPDQKDGREEA